MQTAFQFHPTSRAGALRQPDYWVWGSSAIKGEDGRYHLFTARWSKQVSFLHWAANSEIIRSVADQPEGPYKFEEVVFGHEPDSGRWDAGAVHNPNIHYHDGTYILFYIGVNYPGPRPSTPDNPMTQQWADAWNTKRTGIATSKSIYGPWKRLDAPIMQPRAGQWDAAIISNPAACVREDGSVTVLYKSADVLHPVGQFPGRFRLGVAHAPHWSQPFTRLSDQPIQVVGYPDQHIEDPYLWHTGERYEMVCKDMGGEVVGQPQAGIFMHSEDAIHWHLGEPPMSYSRTVDFDDGTQTTFPKRERPQMLIENGKPTHLFNAILEKDANGNIADSWNLVCRIR
ncbi:glycoside hydrolase family protein [Cerasicoccus fimbriatus]|uniref:glycoside hydrolase family protein n=1 Tax=Cerasicoccus fimbriatus TaxID=3014554 RepID=UPI0022B2C2B2|nr:glycoside hydrolase family protein [Cerasicoccus sp. TK19100]